MALDWVAPLIEGATALTNTTIQAITNRKNRQFQEEQNAITRQREDTAHQREVADLQAAGLSPLASTGGAQTSTPLASEMEAPVIDTTAIRDALALREQKREFDEEMKDRQRQRTHESSEGDKTREVQKQLIESNEEINKKNRESAERIADKQAKTQIDIFNKTQDNLNTDAERYIDEKNYESAKNLEENSEAAYQDFCKTFGFIQSKEYTDVEEYLKAKETVSTWMDNFISHLATTDKEIEPLTSESISSDTGASTGGGFLGINAQSTVNNSQSSSYSREGTGQKALNIRKEFNNWTNKPNGTKLEYPVFRATRNSKKSYTYSKIE